MFKEIIACADGGPEPLWGMDPETSYEVGIYDDEGTILSNFFDTEAEARAAYDRIDAPDFTAEDLLYALETAYEMLVDSWGEEQISAGDDQVANVIKAAIDRAKGNINA